MKISSQTRCEPEDGVLSDLDVTLLGTVVAVPVEYSVALIKDNKSSTSSPYGMGDNLLNDAQIIGIEQSRCSTQALKWKHRIHQIGEKGVMAVLALKAKEMLVEKRMAASQRPQQIHCRPGRLESIGENQNSQLPLKSV